jgi:two-component system chemotaxis response regulator CheB
MPEMNNVRVLIVDDSPSVCRLLKSWLQAASYIEVVGIANNGTDAVKMVAELKPDVVTLDLEMPGMKGLDALFAIMCEHPLPVVVISGVSRKSAALTLQALDMGAIDFILKYTPGMTTDPEKLQQEIITKVRVAARAKTRLTTSYHAYDPMISEQALKSSAWPAVSSPAEIASRLSVRNQPQHSGQQPERVIVIGASTGGPIAVRELISELPGDFPAAVVIVQHLPPAFTQLFAAQLNGQVELTVREAVNGESLQSGTALVAPGGSHLLLLENNLISLDQGAEHHGYQPSIDITMKSAARIWKEQVSGVLLSGMGNDGRDGMQAIHYNGGETYAQEGSTCAIDSMPQSAIEAGLVDFIGSPSEIGLMLRRQIAAASHASA